MRQPLLIDELHAPALRYRLRFGALWLLDDLVTFASSEDVQRSGYVIWQTNDRDHAVKLAEQWAAWRPADFEDGAAGLSFSCPDIVAGGAEEQQP